jgi:large subunit ribosomal protein L19
VRRAKLYYLRGRVGKRARVRERRYTGPEEVVEAGLLHHAEVAEAAAAADDEVPGEAVDAQAIAEAEATETAESSEASGEAAEGAEVEAPADAEAAAGEAPASDDSK